MTSSRTAVITGAGSGIGAALARRAAGSGMNVVLADIDQARLQSTCDSLRKQGATAIAVVTDVSDANAVDRLSDAAFDTFGSVELLVNNAGVESVGHVWDMSPDQWSRVQRINVDGVFHGIRSFVPRMGAAAQPSYVVNMASVASVTSGVLNAAYFTSKHAVLAMTECLYLECREQFPRLHVSVVCPAAVSTRIFEDAETDEATGGSQAAEVLQTMRGHLRDDGMSPDDAAARIFEGFLAGHFWIPTHPERFRELAARRAGMLATLTPPTTSVASQLRR